MRELSGVYEEALIFIQIRKIEQIIKGNRQASPEISESW